MKKNILITILSVILSVCMLIIPLSGCGNSGEDNKQPDDNHGTEIQPQSIILSYNSIDMYVGEIFQLYATISPNNAVSDITWSSENNSCATVDTNGLVSANKEGMTVIKATTKNGLVAACSVSVEIAVGEVSGYVTYCTLSNFSDRVDSGSIIQLISKDLPKFSEDYSITSNYSDENGIYTAVVDNQGNYSFTDVPVGEYRLVFASNHAKNTDQMMLDLMQGNDESRIKGMYGEDLYNKLIELNNYYVNNSELTKYRQFRSVYLSMYKVEGCDVSVKKGKTVTSNRSFVGA
ncbi:MAG: Ig-like domain-containing protein [Candidatus Coproplasma sp.]